MSNKVLLENEGHLETKMGKCFLGERAVLRGKDIHHQLRDLSWLEYYLYSITGRSFSPQQIQVLNFIWISTSYPDPAIWPNHLAALAGSYRSSSTLALVTGTAIAEAGAYGRRPEIRAIDFFIRAKNKIAQGQQLTDIIETEIKKNKGIAGFGRPINLTDERVPHMVNFIKKFAMEKGPHVQIAFETASYLKGTPLDRLFGLSMNVAALDAALAADMGFSPEEYNLFMIPCFLAGMPPCYLEAKEKPQGSFFPLRCSTIVYQGKPPQKWK